jgi:hypothetical protein
LEVFLAPEGLAVAVVVMVLPTVTARAGLKANEALPDASVDTVVWPRKFLPCLVPLRLEKNWTGKTSFGVMLSVPLIVVLPETVLATEVPSSCSFPFG